MNRSQLKIKANKSRDPEDFLKYKKQRNSVLNRNYEKKLFDKLNYFHDPKPLWKTFLPYFSNTHSFGESKVVLTEKGEIMIKNSKVAKTFNSYFASVADSTF